MALTGPHMMLVLVANLAWGFNFIAGKIGADTFGPLFFTGIRFLLLLILMLPWLRPAKGAMKPLLAVAFLLGALHFTMVFIGLHAGGNIASIAITTQLYVPFSAILAAILLRERMGRVAVFATFLAFFGVMLIGFDPIVFDHLDAVFWTMGAALVMALATIIMRQCPGLGVFRLQGWIALVAVPSVFLLSFLFEDGHRETLAATELVDYWTPLYSAIGSSIVGHGLVYYLLCRYPVSTLTPLLLPAPVLATFFGVLLFDDSLGIKLVVGSAMTILGVLALLRGGAKNELETGKRT